MLFFRVIRRALDGWTLHRGASLSASLAYYSLLSLAPVVAATVALVAWFMGSEAARHILASRAQGAFGSSVTQALRATMKPNPVHTGSGLAALFGLAAFVVGGSGIAGELRASLNLVWGVPTAAESWPEMFRNRTREVLIVFALLFAVLAVSLASMVISAAGHILAQALPSPSIAVLAGSATLSLTALLFLFLLIHRYVPDAEVPWPNAVIAAFCTTLMFAVGKEALTAYISKATVGSAFGAGQSVIALLLWAYFSSAVLLLGAECSSAWRQERTPRVAPAKLKVTRGRHAT